MIYHAVLHADFMYFMYFVRNDEYNATLVHGVGLGRATSCL